MVRILGADGEEPQVSPMPGTGRLVPDANGVPRFVPDRPNLKTLEYVPGRDASMADMVPADYEGSVDQVLQRKNRLTGESFGPASSEAQALADLDRALKGALSPVGNALQSLITSPAETVARNVRGVGNALNSIPSGSEPPLEDPALSNLNLSDNDYIQMLMNKKNPSAAEKEALADYLITGQINRLNDIIVPPEVTSGAYSPYGSGDTDNSTLEALRDAIARKEAGTLVPERGGKDKSGSKAVTETDPNRERPLDDRRAVLERIRQEEAFNQMFPGAAEVADGMGLAEQLADTNRGYAQGRYNDLTSFLDAERTRAGAQFDSDEQAIVKQLLGSDAKRRQAEDMYTARRGQSFNELERKLGARTGAASKRLKNLGIDPAGYTDVVGQEMGALLGAQMQSGADLAERMAMLGAERAQLGIGRAKAGMAKERRAFDRNASDMLFQGSQRLSYELQDINEALMNRRISAADAAAASAAAANEARAQASRAMVIGQSIGMPGDAAAASSTFPGLLKEFAGIAADNDQGMAMTLTPEMLPDGFKHLADGERTASLNEIIQFGKIAEQAALYG